MSLLVLRLCYFILMRLLKDPQASAVSPVARFVQEYPIKSLRCHCAYSPRQANRGNVSLENTHPFTRVNCGVKLDLCS